MSPHAAPALHRTDEDDRRLLNEDLADLDSDDLLHELCIAVVEMARCMKREPERGYWIERFRRATAALRGRRG